LCTSMPIFSMAGLHLAALTASSVVEPDGYHVGGGWPLHPIYA
jgi:hypothetical protein